MVADVVANDAVDFVELTNLLLELKFDGRLDDVVDGVVNIVVAEDDVVNCVEIVVSLFGLELDWDVENVFDVEADVVVDDEVVNCVEVVVPLLGLELEEDADNILDVVAEVVDDVVDSDEFEDEFVPAVQLALNPV